MARRRTEPHAPARRDADPVHRTAELVEEAIRACDDFDAAHGSPGEPAATTGERSLRQQLLAEVLAHQEAVRREIEAFERVRRASSDLEAVRAELHAAQNALTAMHATAERERAATAAHRPDPTAEALRSLEQLESKIRAEDAGALELEVAAKLAEQEARLREQAQRELEASTRTLRGEYLKELRATEERHTSELEREQRLRDDERVKLQARVDELTAQLGAEQIALAEARVQLEHEHSLALQLAAQFDAREYAIREESREAIEQEHAMAVQLAQRYDEREWAIREEARQQLEHEHSMAVQLAERFEAREQAIRDEVRLELEARRQDADEARRLLLAREEEHRAELASLVAQTQAETGKRLAELQEELVRMRETIELYARERDALARTVRTLRELED